MFIADILDIIAMARPTVHSRTMSCMESITVSGVRSVNTQPQVVGKVNTTEYEVLSEHLEPGTVVFHCHSAQKQL